MKYNYIIIEGCIGAGKTTLTKMLSKDFECSNILENFEENPYLENFYKDPNRHAFPLELYFMAERYEQQKEIFNKINLFEEVLFADYAFFKSLIFANITLNSDEVKLFKMLFNIIQPNIKKPDLIIYLYNSIDKLIDNITKRGRSFEKNIPRNYLEKLNDAYMNYLKNHCSSKVLILDTTNVDFINKIEDFESVKDILKQEYTKRLNYL